MIKELTTDKEMVDAFEIMVELRTHLTSDSYMELLDQMTEEGYKLFALFDEDSIVSVAGVAIRTNFYYGRHVFVYDLVTKSSGRSKGYGKKLLEYIHQYAKENACGIVALESGLFRTDAHRFYESNLGYEKFCYSFKKLLG